MTKIDQETVRKMAELSALELSAEELERFPAEFSQIIEYVGQLNEVNTDAVEPTSHITGLRNVERPDVIDRELCNKEGLLAAAGDVQDDQIKVKAILE